MNKYQKAFEHFFGLIPQRNTKVLSKMSDFEKNKDLLQELVDKETPLKTIHYISDEGYETHLCGRCKSQVSPYEKGSYCEICGQKIEFDLKLTNYDELPKNEKIIVLGNEER